MKGFSVLLAAALLAVPVAANQLPNGGFETGDLTGWSFGGSFRVEVLQAGDFVPSIAPAEGSSFALLATGPGNVGGPSGFADANGFREYNLAELRVDFTTTSPAVLSFRWAFVTAEVGQPDVFDDVFWVELIDFDGGTVTTLLTGSVNKPGGVSNFPDTPPYDGVSYTVNSPGFTDGNVFSDGVTPFGTFQTPVGAASYRLRFRIADQADRFFDSGLLVDDVRVVAEADLSITKSDGVDTAVPGQPLVYEIVVSNAGPADADDATVTDAFPPTLQGVTWECTAAGGASCTGVDPGDPASGSGDLAETVDLPAGGSVTYTVTATVDQGASGTLTNTATVSEASGCTGDPDPSNNSATDVDALSAAGNVFQLTDTAGASLIAKDGGLTFSPTASRQAAVGGGGSVIAFVSSADLTGGNADAGNEVFVHDGSGFEQITSVAEPLLFLHAGNPELSASGEWIVFESSADLLPPGNADGNREIFRYFRPITSPGTPGLEQVTFTGVADPGCENRTPRIDDDGAVAFATDCGGEIVPGFNPDGNSEVVVWSGGAFSTLETAGCTHRDPSIARGAGGGRVAFLTDCDLLGTNADGNLEVASWAWSLGLAGLEQVTDTPAGTVNDVVRADASGALLAFLSSGDLPGAPNPEGNLEVVTYDRAAGTFAAVTATGSGVSHSYVDLDASGSHAVYERIDALQQSFETFHQELGTGVENTVVVGTATFPAVGVAGSTAVIAFESDDDLPGGTNADGNLELWRALVSP